MTYKPMASEINALRRMTGEYPEESSSYTYADLADAITARNGDLHAAAYDVWMWKAAAVAGLFDWSADGGSYKQGDLYDRFVANAEKEKAQSTTIGVNIIDPELKEVAA